jgi:predicted MFS family arabinose efflux permease
MMVLGWIILRNRPHIEGERHRTPLLRLLLLALGVMAIACADRFDHSFGPLAVLLGIGLVGLTLALDRRSMPKLFPTAFPGFFHPVSLGLWVLMLMPLAEAAVYVYGPYILQVHRGLAPTVAGYFGAIHALAWSVSAMLVAPLAARWHSLAIVAGPTFLTIGLGGLAFTLADSPLPIIAIAMVFIGLGFGVSFSFLTQRVMAATDPGEEDATSAAISTLGGLGGAISAAVAGLVGNSIGLDQPLTMEIVSKASLWLFGGGAVLSAIAIVAAIALLRRLNKPTHAAT